MSVSLLDLEFGYILHNYTARPRRISQRSGVSGFYPILRGQSVQLRALLRAEQHRLKQRLRFRELRHRLRVAGLARIPAPVAEGFRKRGCPRRHRGEPQSITEARHCKCKFPELAMGTPKRDVCL